MCLTLDWEDMPTLYSESKPISRKPHQCSECHRIIEKGEPYKRAEGVWNGSWQTFKTCQHCCALQNWLEKECGNYSHGDLKEEIREHAHEYNHFGLAKGLAGIYRKWKKFKSEDLMQVPNLRFERS